MSTPLLKAHKTYQKAIHKHWVLRGVGGGEKDIIATRKDLENESRKRRIDPNDEEAVMAIVKRDNSRKVVDRSVRLAMLDFSDVWTFHEITTPFEPRYCNEEACWFKTNPDENKEFNGFMESHQAMERGRRCTKCFAQLRETSLKNAILARKHWATRGAESLLLEESMEEPYASEQDEDIANRILSADEWRTLTPPMHCSVCVGSLVPAVHCDLSNPQSAVCASTNPDHAFLSKYLITSVARFQGCIMCPRNTPATHVLIGWQKMRLCDDHYELRADVNVDLVWTAKEREYVGH